MTDEEMTPAQRRHAQSALAYLTAAHYFQPGHKTSQEVLAEILSESEDTTLALANLIVGMASVANYAVALRAATRGGVPGVPAENTLAEIGRALAAD
ncbi:hypothetical protein ACLQ3K_16140 [Tsukamurella sp. DT100]|uniref:hypothetical protein n=1 Tax=Tsukamurella sp. DT100 TaxID=3393415 RepID=UPI003CE9382C